MKFIDKVAEKYLDVSKKTVKLLGNLNLIIVIVLVTSLSTAYSLNKTLDKCQKNYSTIGVVEYLGNNYPDITNKIDEKIADAKKEFNDFLDLNNEYLLGYQPFNTAFGYIGPNEIANNREAANKNAVLVIKISQKKANDNGEVGDFYYGTCVKQLYSNKDALNKMMVIECSKQKLLDDHCYLLHGTYFYTGSYLSISVSDFSLGDLGICIKDVTSNNCYELNDINEFNKMVDTYQIIKNGIEVISTKNAKDDYCFQNGLLSLKEGTYFTDSGCVISQRLADYYNLGIDDVINLSLVTKENCFIDDSFYIDDGFDRSVQLKITGIFEENEEYNNRIYISEVTDYDMSISNTSYTLGTLKIKNGYGQQYLDSVHLPPGIRVTIYDQGYLLISSSLISILRMVNVIALVSVICCLAFFVFYGYLLVYKQAGISRNMTRMGTEKKDIFRYFRTITLRICSYRNCLAIGIGYLLTIGISFGLGFLLVNVTNTSILFSNSALAKSQSLFDLSSEPSILFSFLIGTLALGMALLSTYIFTLVSFKKEQHASKIRHLVKAKTHSLSGKGWKYSYLSIIRGGIRSLIAVLLIISCGLLFAQLEKVTNDTRNQLDSLRKNTSVIGYFTDIYGQKLSNLVIRQDEINILEQQEYISQLAKYRSAPYELKYCLKNDGSLIGPGFNRIPQGSFAREEYVDHLASLNKIVSTNSISNSVDFLYSQGFRIQWLEGYDESFLSEKNKETICLVPSKMAKEFSMELGDSIIVETILGSLRGYSFENIKWIELKIVGIYYDDGSCNNIYTDKYFISNEVNWDNTQEYSLKGFTITRNFRFTEIPKRASYGSVTFKVDDCSHLSTLKGILLESGYSQPEIIRSFRSFISFNDASYLANERSLTQRLWYMQILFPMIYLGCFIICFLISYSNINSRRKEFRIMHSLGTPKKQMISSFLIEQLIMAFLGLFIAIMIIYTMNVQSTSTKILLVIITVSYLLGSIFGIKKNLNIQHKVKGEN